MSTAKDLLGRPPVMRRVRRGPRDDRRAFQGETRDGLTRVRVPGANTSPGSPSAIVTRSAAPRERT
ncbi:MULTISPECIES: hypothetical protein [Salipiger]|jgi:hypothetical protein|uniref:hypothetical protein n=1 Tax=Salipiger TaxID=263377 RepID=UPI0008E2554B|nr:MULTISPECIES: hypothetical protein [Salipiger]GGA13845.1 hypothetical protein GCM10011326_27450 [Salipiger profundus]SFD16573.1 hypothetical protein SAMN05444415_10821 [Salipiger profundus]